MTTATASLTDFLLARIAEDEAAARDVFRGDEWHLESDWRDGRSDLVGGGKILASFAVDEDSMAPLHVERWSPARVLAECEAKRAIVETASRLAEWDEMGSSTAEDGRAILSALAAIYSDHEDYSPAWA